MANFLDGLKTPVLDYSGFSCKLQRKTPQSCGQLPGPLRPSASSPWKRGAFKGSSQRSDHGKGVPGGLVPPAPAGFGVRPVNPINWVRLASPYFNRVDIAAELYDNEIFEAATFQQLQSNGRPFVIISATSLKLSPEQVAGTVGIGPKLLQAAPQFQCLLKVLAAQAEGRPRPDTCSLGSGIFP